jgi:iron complex outermembrane receptor protein
MNNPLSRTLPVFLALILALQISSAFGQNAPLSSTAAVDTPYYRNPYEVVITASRVDLPLKNNPAAITVVDDNTLKSMPRGIAVDEALRLVPGVRIDNQADGSRVHLSIRGQGILSERGIRGIKILQDGLPLNDPSGFAPDLYDIDWATVDRVEVLRGPAAALYGGGSAAGVVNIQTLDGTAKPEAEVVCSAGSYGFWKTLGQIRGETPQRMRYRVSASRMMGDGYRQHTHYWANNFYAKANWTSTSELELTPVFSWTDYYNENPEGLNRAQVAADPRQANPDAIPRNEYQKTTRITNGVSGKLGLSKGLNAQFNGYVRLTRFREAVPSSIQFRTLTTPGATVQCDLHHRPAGLKNQISLGSDVQWQTISEYRTRNLAGDTTHALQAMLSNQTIHQSSAGLFLIDQLELHPHWTVLLSLRYDNIHNQLDDQMGGTDNLSGLANFEKVTGRFGVSWALRSDLSLYANWGQGFLPPATEELVNNPDHFGGFNTHLTSATSQGEELGTRGTIGEAFRYEATGFYLTTDKDFDRYRVYNRNLETFYRNLGASRRIGVESLLSWTPWKPLNLQMAYTYSQFKYTTESAVTELGVPDSLAYTYSIKDHWLPNSPRHQSCFDVQYDPLSGLTVGASVEAQSRWYVDSRNSAYVNGFTLCHARVAYRVSVAGVRAELSLAARNLLGAHYIAFSEPDPDGNSYQPGPTEEFFGGVKIQI